MHQRRGQDAHQGAEHGEVGVRYGGQLENVSAKSADLDEIEDAADYERRKYQSRNGTERRRLTDSPVAPFHFASGPRP